MSKIEQFVCNLVRMLIGVGVIVCTITICVIIALYTQPAQVSGQTHDDTTSVEEYTTIELDNKVQDEIQEEPVIEDKYASVYAWQVYSGDFGTEQMEFLKEQCEKYDIPMEIMLSIICTESGFRSNAKASSSTASGYCQILEGSAEWVYESLLKYGEYDIDNHVEIMTTDWRLNIEMGCRIIYCWYWNSDESWEAAVQRYHGGSEEAKNTYLNAVNNHMKELFNMTITDFE